MKHYRDPTCRSVPKRTTSNPSKSNDATPALQHFFSATPTLLLSSKIDSGASKNAIIDLGDDFSSNAWIDLPSQAGPLAGLGISHLTDIPTADMFLGKANSFQEMDLQMQPNDRINSISSLPSLSQGSLSDHSDDLFSDAMPSTSLLASSLSPSATRNRDLAFRFDFAIQSDGRPGFDTVALSLLDDFALQENHVGLVPDINMYNAYLSMHSPTVSVNPVDTVGPILSPLVESSEVWEPVLPMPDPNPVEATHDDILHTNVPEHRDCPSPTVIKDIMVILTQSNVEQVNSATLEPSSPQERKEKVRTPYQQPILPFLNTTNYYAPDNNHYALPGPSNETSLSASGFPTDTMHSSPILNAHLGIDLSELTEKAERYKLRNPGQEVHRSWLSHFAGKLSERGELLNDFRCYINGCGQRNKRRDHILVHVGAHIGQRPFACTVWSVIAVPVSITCTH